MTTEYTKIWRRAIPLLQRCRPGDLVHTTVAIRHLQEILPSGGQGIDERIVVPTVILHDIGWSKCPEELVTKFFDKVKDADRGKLREQHMRAGSGLARTIMGEMGWDPTRIKAIAAIIAKHDNAKEMISPMEKIVFDADVSWQYSSEGYYLDLERFVRDETFTPEEGIKRLEDKLDWFKTKAGKDVALRELAARREEIQGSRI